MPSDSVVRFTVAHAGLDALHAVRLKAACNLLMAGHMQVALEEWSGGSVHLLVASDDDAGRSASALAGRSGVPILHIVRSASEQAGSSLPRNVSVLQLSRRLAELLPAKAEGDPGGREAPLIRHLLTGGQGLFTAQDGAARMVIDPERGCLHLLSAMGDDELLARAAARSWLLAPLPQQRFDEELSTKVHRRVLIESFFWMLASGSQQPLLDPSSQGELLQLRAWPVVPPGGMPAQWLLPVSCLLQRPWSLESLLMAGGGNREMLLRIFAAARASGLAVHAAAAPKRAVRKAVKGDRFFARVARRFGLDFFGVTRGK